MILLEQQRHDISKQHNTCGINLMIIKKEISEDEAFFRYLNIINSFENDKQKMSNKMNAFRIDYNYIGLENPLNLNCNVRFLNVCM